MMSDLGATLSTPLNAGTLRLRNRFAMAPMTRMRSPDGVLTAANVEYYRRRAAGGVGLIVTEGSYIRGPAGPSASVPRLYGDVEERWRALSEAVHGEGAAVMPQLWHLGAARGDAPELLPDVPDLSPSGLGLSGDRRGRAMTEDDLDAVAAAYAEAAVIAQRAGCDGVEVHGAHGYLLDQFMWERTNHRLDEYGGSVERRSAFPARVVREIRSAVGADFAISYRFSQWKGDQYDVVLAAAPAVLERVLAPLVEAGVDMFHVSTRRHWQPAFAGDGRSLAWWTKHLTGLPVVIVGSVGVDRVFRHEDEHLRDKWARLGELVQQFRDGEFDVVALGRALLADPDWVNKVIAGRLGDVVPFTSLTEISE